MTETERSDAALLRTALSLQPYLVFEQCRVGWKESPINVKRKGVLHESWRRFTESVRVVEVAKAGMYMHSHLERVRENDFDWQTILVWPAVNRFERSIDSLVLDFARTARIAIDFYSAGMAIKQGMARLAMFEWEGKLLQLVWWLDPIGSRLSLMKFTILGKYRQSLRRAGRMLCAADLG
jgi:hypothetical protein